MHCSINSVCAGGPGAYFPVRQDVWDVLRCDPTFPPRPQRSLFPPAPRPDAPTPARGGGPVRLRPGFGPVHGHGRRARPAPRRPRGGRRRARPRVCGRAADRRPARPPRRPPLRTPGRPARGRRRRRRGPLHRRCSTRSSPTSSCSASGPASCSTPLPRRLRSVLTEYERFYDRPTLDRGDVYAFRDAGIEAVEPGFATWASRSWSTSPARRPAPTPRRSRWTSTTKVESYVTFLLAGRATSSACRRARTRTSR